eukprot:SAG11_NODE_3512_length_2400_cov_1.364031_2_plen_75_part_00
MDADSKKAAIIILLFLVQLREYSADSSTKAPKNGGNETVVDSGATTRRSQTQIYDRGIAFSPSAGGLRFYRDLS